MSAIPKIQADVNLIRRTDGQELADRLRSLQEPAAEAGASASAGAGAGAVVGGQPAEAEAEATV